jgi:ubiquitin-protein ligase E3 B
LDVQFAEFLLARLLGRNVFLEELKELDEEVWRNLTFIKHYEGIYVKDKACNAMKRH